ncbi:MAG TPA: NAD(P)-binding protein, partial [Gammaproteobacteria bacterium]|nr:NAD(P)-binding protein [Gammaproteobacteria bacterium]
MKERESMEFDIVIVGGGPAGLSAAIRLIQLNKDLSICVLDKAAEIGGQIISGAVLEPRALDELIPDWQTQNGFSKTPVTKDQFFFLT